MSKGNAVTLGRGIAVSHESRWRIKPIWALPLGAYGDLIGTMVGKEVLGLNILAFLLGRVSILGELMPFGLAYFTAVTRLKRTSALAVAIWTSVGSLSMGYSFETVGYMAIMLSYYYLTSKETRVQKRLLTISILMGVGAILVATTALVWQQITLYQMMLLGFNISACLILATIFSTALPVISSVANRQITEEQVVCLVVLLSAAIAGLGQMELFGYSLRNVASGFFIMALSLQGGIGLGVSVGTAIGIVAGLNTGNGAFSIAYYAVASLLSGAFTSLGKFAVALGYMTGCIIAIAYFTSSLNLGTNVNTQIIASLIEASIGAVLFLAVPTGWWTSWRKMVCQYERTVTEWDGGLIATDLKLRQLSEMFNDLAATFGQTQPASTTEPVEDIRQVVDQLGAQVCRNCERKVYCWEEQFYKTYQAFIDLLSLPPTVKLTMRNMPTSLQDCCIHKQELLTAAMENMENKRVQLFWQKKTLDYRCMLAEQMRSAGGIISTLAAELQHFPSQDKQAEARLLAATLAGGCELEEIRVSGEAGNLRITGRKAPCCGEQECVSKLLPIIGETLGVRMTVEAACGSKVMRRKCRLTLTTATHFAVTVGAASIAKNLNNVSGDTCSVSEAGKGRVAAIISDGMGSGTRAAGESQAAVRFLEKLLSAGFSVDAAVKSVNAMLLLRLPGESYTTIDVAIFDLYSGEVEFLKTGSAVSYIKRVREVSTIQSTSLPVGIIEQVEIEPQRRNLVPGDTVIMISDGVAEADRQKPRRDWMSNFLRLAPDDDPERLANLILEQAKKLAGPVVNDDMTVLVIKVHERLGTM